MASAAASRADLVSYSRCYFWIWCSLLIKNLLRLSVIFVLTTSTQLTQKHLRPFIDFHASHTFLNANNETHFNE